MTPDEYARVKRIVANALALPAELRAEYTRDACGSDAGLGDEVDSLLAAAVRAAELYEDPVLVVPGGAPAVVDQVDRLPSPDLRPPSSLLFAPAIDDFTGTDRYSVHRRIGAGGMGVVYEVEDRLRGQRVALKTLRRRDDIYQLKTEFRNLADVSHPNLIAMYELVVDEQRCFFTMELVAGLTFVEYARGAASISERGERVRRTLPQLIAGVEELHRRGIQHRDIKPSNVLVTPAGRVVILDFGLTAAVPPPLEDEYAIVGTPAYLSPEQCRGGVVSSTADWYGVGATVYHALTGRVPFDGPVHDVMARKALEDPPPPTELAPGAPVDISEICMRFLDREPATRLSGRGALERLAAEDPTLRPADPAVEPGFVGREGPLGVICSAFDDVKAGRSAFVVIHGPSGIGKSALLRAFFDRRLRQEPILLLRSRCHEHETIPYKALDGVIDGVTQFLRTLSTDERARLLPDDTAALVRLFPVMRALGVEPRSDRDDADPIVLRRAAFAAFRELLSRLAASRPVILEIDDLHWADADGVRWLTELLHPPSPPSLLVLLAFRSEEIAAKPFLRALVERVDIGERRSLALPPMSDREVSLMIDALAAADECAPPAQQEEIARASGGNPFLVEALTRHGTESSTRDVVSLDAMLTRRLETLPSEARAFLEVLAVCGRPVLPARIFEACGLRGDDRPLVDRLRAVRLVKSSRSGELIEMYHDKIRETLAAAVSDDAARRTHDRLARVLVAHGDDDPEALFDHYRAAGHLERAAGQAAAAAARASEVLAFDLAASFYHHALTLQPDSAQRLEWTQQLARAFENAGRPVESADAYLSLAEQTRGSDQLEWRRKAAELLLIGGQIDRGLAVSDDVLRSVGMRLARGPRTAIVSLALRRLQLRWRGLDFTAHEASQIPPDALVCVDACWAISSGLAMVDPIRAAAFNVRQLLQALDLGEPYRIARAMALEAGFSVVGVGAGLHRSEVFSRRAKQLAAHAGHRYVAALTMLWEGIAGFLTGQWKKASDLCGRAATILREECTGVIWELNMAHNFFLGGLVSQGELREVARHLPVLLTAARERGNFYLELELNTRMILAWLAADDPDGADRRGNEGIARWSQRGFQRQHYSHVLMRVQSELYRGHAREAWRLIESCQRPLKRSLFLRVQHTRIERANYRARCALAMAAAGHDVSEMRGIAAREAERLRREGRPWSDGFAHVLQATLAYQGGRVDAAITRLVAAIQLFDDAGMQLYAAVSRCRLAELRGGEAGRTLQASAENWMALQEIRNPAGMVRLIAPGFAE